MLLTNIQKRETIIIKCISYILILLFLLIVLYPIVLMFLISFKSSEDFFTNPLGFPKVFHIRNYLNVWKEAHMGRLFLNTILITGSTILLTMLIASLAGFALTKYQFKGRKLFFFYFMLGMIIPVQVLMVSLMRVSRFFHLQNTYALLIFLFTVFSLSLAIFLYMGFFKSIPSSLIEAAIIDGASFVGILGRIILPLSTTINVIVAILVGMNPWKDFLIPLLFSNDISKQTLSLGILQFQKSFYTNWPYVFSMMVMQTIPILILFILFQKYFIKGIVQGAVKS